MEQNNLRLGDKVDLSNLLEISNPDAQEIVLISDSDSVQEVSFSECVNEDATIKQEDKIDIIYNNVDETTLQNNEGR